MIGTTTALIASAAIGAGASVLGARSASRAADRSAQAVQQATDSSNATQLQIYNQQRTDSEPWRQFGLQALGQLSQMYGMNWQAPQTMQQPQWQGGTNTGSGTGTGTGGVGQGYNTGGSGFIGNLLSQTPGNTQTGLPTPPANDVAVLQGSGGSVAGVPPVNALLGGGRADGAASADQPLVNGGPTPTPTVAPGTPITGGGTGGTMTGTGPTPTPATGTDFSSFYASPDYQYRLEQGNRNLTNAFANTGNLDSGAAQRALLRFGQGEASGAFNDYRNFLLQSAGMGQVQNQSNNALAQGYANNVQANNSTAAAARASAYASQGQAWQQGLGGAAGAGMWALNNWGGAK